MPWTETGQPGLGCCCCCDAAGLTECNLNWMIMQVLCCQSTAQLASCVRPVFLWLPVCDNNRRNIANVEASLTAACLRRLCCTYTTAVVVRVFSRSHKPSLSFWAMARVDVLTIVTLMVVACSQLSDANNVCYVEESGCKFRVTLLPMSACPADHVNDQPRAIQV